MEGQITALLRRSQEGDPAATEELIPLVYAELHRIARRHLRAERRDHTLQATALVNEAYLRIFAAAGHEFPARAHFLAFASGIMRSVLVDYARTRSAAKRGGGGQRAEFEHHLEMTVAGGGEEWQLLELDRVLTLLAARYPEEAEVIEMRYFGGLTARETAELRGRSIHTVQHQLRFAHAWLRRKLAGELPRPRP